MKVLLIGLFVFIAGSQAMAVHCSLVCERQTFTGEYVNTLHHGVQPIYDREVERFEQAADTGEMAFGRIVNYCNSLGATSIYQEAYIQVPNMGHPVVIQKIQATVENSCWQ